MTTATARIPQRPVVDPVRWPDLVATRHRLRATLESAVARRLFLSVAHRLAVRVELEDRVVGGAADDPGAPVMHLRHPEAFFRAVGAKGLIGFGESYMTGDWDSPDLAAVLEVFAAEMATLVPAPLQALRAAYVARAPGTERNTTTNTRSNIARHYDLSNDMFATFLDEGLSYSSALFAAQERAGTPVAGEQVVVSEPLAGEDAAGTLADGQLRKIERVLDAAAVGPGSRVLEIGSGWGELAIRAAERGASVLTITLSSEQRDLARERVAAAGHADRVDVELLDYRLVEGRFDAVVSVEMIEAVGHEYWRDFFQTIDRLLAPGGRVALQAITMPHDRMLATRYTYTWINKYIFPGGFLPSTEAIDAITREHTGLRVVRRLSFGQHYARTLRLWDEQFADRLEQVRRLGFDDVFVRMWHFYLDYSRAGFSSGYLDVQQIELAREGGR